MSYKIRKLKTFRLNESSLEIIEMAKKNHIPISMFVREAIKEKFERDYPVCIKDQHNKNLLNLPF